MSLPPPYLNSCFSPQQPKALSVSPFQRPKDWTRITPEPFQAANKLRQSTPEIFEAAREWQQNTPPPLKRRRIEPLSLVSPLDLGDQNIENASHNRDSSPEAYLGRPVDQIISICSPLNNYRDKLVCFRSGKKYDGGWSNGKPHGPGTMIWPDGRRLKGNFIHGKLPYGTMVYPQSDSKRTYMGDFKDELPHGHGQITYANGNSYVGEIKEGLRHGKGKIISAAGIVAYDGEWENDTPHGQGTRNEENGSYTGQWSHGVPNGKGVLSLRDGRRFEGRFTNGNLPSGKIFYQDGSIYEGSIKNQEPHGWGVLSLQEGEKEIKRLEGTFAKGQLIDGTVFYPNGMTYKGPLKDEKPHGFGKAIYPNGQFYEGWFKHGKYHGEGKFFSSKGTLLHAGEWEDDLPNGEGMGFLLNGVLFIGRFENGYLISKKKNEELPMEPRGWALSWES